jgi:hypothetical protein
MLFHSLNFMFLCNKCLVSFFIVLFFCKVIYSQRTWDRFEYYMWASLNIIQM